MQRQAGSRSRPGPVSCQLCRVKKLKCNQVQPCSNCVARGVGCVYVRPPAPGKERRNRKEAGKEGDGDRDGGILERLERLEGALLGKGPMEAEGRLVESGQDDERLLENVGVREDALLSCLSDGLSFKLCTGTKSSEDESCTQVPTPVSHVDTLGDSIVTFPTFRMATLLLENYEAHANHVMRVVHIPTVRTLMKNFYLRINQHQSPPPGQAALLLAIFATGAFFFEPHSTSAIAKTQADALRLSKYISKLALNVMDYSRRETSGTLEDVQASILMSQVVYHIDGYSARSRFLSTVAISISRDLRLHRLDTNNCPKIATNTRALIDQEVKRRVFWWIASNDWLESTISGPQEGVYFIHPSHITVNLPQDCADDEIAMVGDHEPRDESQPSIMTYFLEKIRLSHLCREMVDTVPLETSKLLQLPYEQILALDRKIQDFISTTPYYFRIDEEGLQRSKALEIVYPTIPCLRFILVTAVYSRRCKLHQRFLLRQSLDPRYAFSRKACLESARAVIQLYGELMVSHSESTMIASMGMAVHFTHLALAVLVMDLCFNAEADDGKQVKADLSAALKLLRNTGSTLPLAQRSLSSLTGILKKHNVHLNEPSPSTDIISHVDGLVPGTESTVNSTPQNEQLPTPFEWDADFDHNVTVDANSFDEFWQTAFQNDTNLDSAHWDHLFSALDSRPVM
ncbi:hypothetical protein B0J11DRAFT_436016 [Dendryphion nanum]|uniref:Zn(2)-C6 fungal-type domain-containing protein n=1 Tax=Dendryphion nanum TaxID=256645 RepID=A0A9P9IK89_9PLEO|nr:hypothetical protein B0J11DRAFT_436016 [Dendryphion nanum]